MKIKRNIILNDSIRECWDNICRRKYSENIMWFVREFNLSKFLVGKIIIFDSN